MFRGGVEEEGARGGGRGEKGRVEVGEGLLEAVMRSDRVEC